MIGVSILHFEGERTADGVEAIDRIAGNERQPVDGVLRDQVPIDDIAEHLVDANAVLVDGEPLRRADDRARDITAIIEIELELIAGLTAQCDSGQRLHHRLQKVRRLRVVECRSPDGLDV